MWTPVVSNKQRSHSKAVDLKINCLDLFCRHAVFQPCGYLHPPDSLWCTDGELHLLVSHIFFLIYRTLQLVQQEIYLLTLYNEALVKRVCPLLE